MRSYIRMLGSSSLVPNSIVTFSLRVGAAVTVYLTYVLLARYMAQDQLGHFVAVQSGLWIAASAAGLGLMSGATRFIPSAMAHGRKGHVAGYISWSRRVVFASSLVCGAIAATVVLAIDRHFSSPYSLPVIAAAASIPFAGLITLNGQISRSLNWILFASMTNTFLRPVALLAVLALSLIAFGVAPDALFVFLIQLCLLGCLLAGQSFFLSRKLSTLNLPGPDVSEKRLWLSTSLILLISDLYFAFSIDIHVLVSGFFLSAADLAVFNAVLRTLSIVGFASTAVGIAFAPQVAQLFASGDRDELTAVARRALAITFWPALFLLLLQVVFADPILSLFGPLYVNGRHALQVGAVAQLAIAFATPLVPMLGMTGNHRMLFWISLSTAVLAIGSHALLTPRFGMMGSAWALLLASIVWCAQLFFWVSRSLQIQILRISTAKP